MRIELEGVIQNEIEFTVKKEDSAEFLGSGEVSVLSTPAMIAMMENTARLAVEDKLPEGYTTVGVKVCVSHIAPAPIGARIRVVAKLMKQEGRKLVFEVKAYWRDIKIGEGIHERYIVNRERFLDKIKNRSM